MVGNGIGGRFGAVTFRGVGFEGAGAVVMAVAVVMGWRGSLT
ncbi:hypothetical protein [Cyanobium sp. Lug-B]|nr:hypothetical protein [Cyanobium sp. Lug-B]